MNMTAQNRKLTMVDPLEDVYVCIMREIRITVLNWKGGIVQCNVTFLIENVNAMLYCKNSQ